MGKGSSPRARARNDARRAFTSKSRASSFAEAWSPNNSNRSRPPGANRLAQQFRTSPAQGGNGLFGRFSARPTLDPYNPGCAGGPRSVTVLSSQGEYQPDGYSEEQIQMYEKNLRYSELAKDPQLMGKERPTNPKSQKKKLVRFYKPKMKV